MKLRQIVLTLTEEEIESYKRGERLGNLVGEVLDQAETLEER